MTVSADDFLVALKERITAPANQVLLTDASFLRIADKVTREKMVPLLLSTNQNFFVTTQVTALVSGQDTYPINYRAIGRGLRDLKLQNATNTANTFNLTLIALEDEQLFVNQSIPTGFFFSGDKIILRPVPVTTQFNLQQFFNLQPNSLVLLAAACKVTGISGAVVTCGAVPATFTAGVKVDFIQGTAGTSTISFDVALTSVTATTLTFASASLVPTTLVVGDYVALAQQSPVIQLPDEAVPLLETWVGQRALYAVGDFDGANLLKADAAEQERDLLKILEPRIEGEATKIVNRHGLLRGKGFNSWRVRGGFYF